MARLVWTDEALRWLKEIHAYIARDNPAAADRVVEGITDRAEQLTTFPDLGQRLILRKRRDLRLLLYGHYRIAYRVPRQDLVEILGVYHGALDLERGLPKPPH